ncbi:hypothetical protein [Actinospica sp.]|uniref:hypothetical protein n=1 Tax=Actinospica sp. TaxID=1872142 RepID=UPI002B90B24B|nr:hypothetical protein [Actinospica sp.]HWG28375.1 hypothetical protein [Actinospica sp.]
MTEPQEPRGAAPAHPTSDELSECAFSPETAGAGLLEHAEGCAQCSAELADLRLLLTELAALPEPEVPDSVAIRMDAAVARAWLEVDAEREAAAQAAAAPPRRGRRLSWRKLAIPLGSLALIALVGVGVGVLANQGQSGTSASSASGAAAEKAPGSNSALTDPNALAWVRSVLPSNTNEMSSGPMVSPMVQGVHCADPSVPQRSGYTVLTTSHREYESQTATLVVYQDTQKPASPTYYAVVYAGPCPSSTAEVLVQGLVSR